MGDIIKLATMNLAKMTCVSLYIFVIYPSATERRHVCDYVTSVAAICTAAGAGSIASSLKATNAELFRQLKKLATEKGRQVSFTSLASARNASAKTVQATRS